LSLLSAETDDAENYTGSDKIPGLHASPKNIFDTATLDMNSFTARHFGAVKLAAIAIFGRRGCGHPNSDRKRPF
jgi:hypothetical protein